MIAIRDTQHLIENSTFVELMIAKEDMSKLQHSLSEKKKLTTPKGNVPDDGQKDTQDDMAIDVCDPVDKPSKSNWTKILP